MVSLAQQFYEEQQKKKKPSQVAAEENKSSGGSLSENFYNAVKAGDYKETPKVKVAQSQPSQVSKTAPQPQSNPIAGAIDAIKKAAQTAIDSVQTALKGNQVVSPIPQQDQVQPTTPDQVKAAIDKVKVNPQNNVGLQPDLGPSPVAGASPQRVNPTVKAPNVIDSVLRIGSAYLDTNKPLKDATTTIFNDYYKNFLNSPIAQAQNTIMQQIPFKPVKDFAKADQQTREQLGKGIIQGFARTTLNSSDIVRNALDKEVQNTPKEFQGARNVGEMIGTIATYIAPDGALEAKLGKTGLALLFGVLGQTSTPSTATTNQRIQKAIVDTTAGAVLSFLKTPAKVLSLKNLGIKSGELTALTAQVYGDIRALGGSHQQALDATKDAFVFNLGLMGAMAAFGVGKVATQKAFESKIKTGNIEMTPEQARVQVEGTNLKGTKAGDTIIKAANDAEAQGKNLQIFGIAAEKSRVASIFKADTPEGFGFAINLVEKQKVARLDAAEGQTTPAREPGTPPENLPSVVKEAVTPKTAETPAPQVTTTPQTTPSVSKGNRAFNQKNAQEISKAVVAGEKEAQRLSNPDQLRIAKKYEVNNLPADATPDTLVTVYRAGKSSETKTGDFVTLDKANAEKYVGQREGAKVMTAKVPLKDLVFSGGTKSEFIYSPAKEAAPAKTELTLAPDKVKPTEKPAITKSDIKTLLDNSPEFKANPVLTVINDGMVQEGNNIDVGRSLVFQGKKVKFSISAKALGLDYKKLKKGDKIRVDPNSLKGTVQQMRVYSGGNVHAAKGVFADLPKQTPPTSKTPALEFPELVRIAKELTGKTPILKAMKSRLGDASSKDLRLRLHPKIFKDPDQAGKVLAHELGHIADFLPDTNQSRGNLVGRIASLKKNMKAIYGDIKNKEVRKELMDLSAKWRPAFEGAKGIGSELKGDKYRTSSSELYADAISVLFNDPAMLKNEAPKFWDGFFKYLDRKPTVKENFFATWDLLNKGEEAIFQQRQADVEKMFDNSEQQFLAKNLEKQQEKTNLSYTLKLLFNNVNEPLIRKVNEARKAGTLIDDSINPVYAYEGLNYLDGKLENFVQKNYEPIFKKAQEISDDGWTKLGSVLLYERSMNERGEMANPLGFNPKTAADQLKGLEKSMSPEDWKTLQDTLKLFRTATQDIISMAEKSGFYSPDLINQMKANNSYATYQVIDYLDTYVSAHVYKAVGTLKEIANPATSTIMKGISVMKAIERNNAKRSAVEFFKKNFPNEITPAKSVFKGKRMEFIESKDPTLKMIRVVEDGKMKAYYVDKDLANTINRQSNDTIIKTAKIARVITGAGIYRPLFTSFNLGFSTFNFVRDFQRYWANVPDYTLLDAITSFPRAIYRYTEAIPASAARARNKQNATITAMKELNIIGATYNGVTEHQEVDPEDKQIERIMKQYGILDKTKHKKIFSPIFKLLDSVEAFNNFVETLPKVAGYNELKGKNHMTPLEMADFLRTKVGSPNFRTRGQLTPVTNSVFLFSNAIKEGIKSDYQIATGKVGRHSQAGFWWKTIASTFLPKLIMMAGLLGLFGAWYQDRMKDVSEYDKTNFTIIPTGTDKDGKTTYLRIPQAETQRFLGGLFWKIMRNAARKDLKLEDIFDVFDYGAGQLPNLSPAITGTGALLTYLSGHNPYDSFRNRNIIPDTEFAAGFEKSFPIFVDWFTKNQGAGIILPSYIGTDPTELQKRLALPFISNVVGRWLKVSDYGQNEEAKRITDQAARESANKTIDTREKLDKAIKEYKGGAQNSDRKKEIEKKLVKDVVGIPLTSEQKTARTNLINKFEIGLVYGTQGPLTDSLIKASTNQQKVDLLNNARSNLGSNFDSFVSDLKKKKVISSDVIKKLKKK